MNADDIFNFVGIDFSDKSAYSMIYGIPGFNLNWKDTILILFAIFQQKDAARINHVSQRIF